ARRHPDRQHLVRVGDGRRRARHRSANRALLRRHEALHRRKQEALDRGAREDLRRQRAQGVQALPEGALTRSETAMSARRTSSSDRAPRGGRSRRAGAGALAFAVLGAAFVAHAATAQPAASTTDAAAQRVIAVSDVHGAYDELVGLLKTARLLDDKLAW